MLRVGFGYSCSLDLNALRERVSMTCVASWRGNNLIDVPKNSQHPPFIIYHRDDMLVIEISTFHLTYTIEMEGNVLYLTFRANDEDVSKATHFAGGLISSTPYDLAPSHEWASTNSPP